MTLLDKEEARALGTIGVPRDLPAISWWCRLRDDVLGGASPAVVAAKLVAEPPAVPFGAVTSVPIEQEDLWLPISLHSRNLMVALLAVIYACFGVAADQQVEAHLQAH